MKVPDWFFVAIPRGAKARGSKSFNPFTELGSMLALRNKGMSKAVQTNSPTQNYDLYQIYSTISTYIVPEVTTGITGFAWQRMVDKARMNPGHVAESDQGLV